MGMLPMVETTTTCHELLEWPLFYMNDFSVMGIIVPQLSSAVKALESKGFRIDRDSVGVKIRFEGQQQMARIFKTLQLEKISFAMTDLIDHVYQG